MLVTSQWIDGNKTPKGAWTKAQFAALGESWPPAWGWRTRVIGTEIPDDAAAKFEAGRNIGAKESRAIELKARGIEPPCRPLTKQERKALKMERKRAKTKLRKLAAAPAAEPKKSPRPKPAPKQSLPPEQAAFVASPEFLASYEWRKLRMQALKKHGAICQCCGASPSTGAVMNVDHIKPRRTHPHLALSIDNLQILCHECNHGKGNWDMTDWRRAPAARVAATPLAAAW